MFRIVGLFCALAVVALLGACGNKGDLVKPSAPPAPENSEVRDPQ